MDNKNMDKISFKLERIKLDLSEGKLASELGIKPNTVSRYETGKLAIPKVVAMAFEVCGKRFSDDVGNRFSDKGAAIYSGENGFFR